MPSRVLESCQASTKRLCQSMTAASYMKPRSIGSGGRPKLTGYGGGLWRKEWLLRHEGVLTGLREGYSHTQTEH